MKRSKLWALTIFQVLSLSACGREVDCDIHEEHFHYYQTQSGIERLMDSEKEYNGEYEWQDDYVQANQEYRVIVENSLCILSDNLEYVERRWENKPETLRYQLIREYIPEHYGILYIPGKNDEIGSIIWGMIPETYEEHWEEINIDEPTKNLVKDIEYQLLLYRILPDGTLESKTFDDLDNIPCEYNYFKTGNLLTKVESEEYYLDSEKKKVNKTN